MQLIRLAQSKQDFEGYFQGQVPDYAAGLIGTPSVDASQVQSAFGNTNAALKMVNAFSADTLTNIAFVFNFSKGGAYGVYVPALDRAIKAQELRHRLEGKGYKIADEQGLMVAYPKKEEKQPEEIDAEIKQEWNSLANQGGTSIGVNVASIMNAADQNSNEIVNKLKSSAQGVEVPPQVITILKNALATYHLAATIVHEADHSRGGDEGSAQAVEGTFRSFAQNQLNEQYKRELDAAGLSDFYAPLELGSQTLNAKSNSWYKVAQFAGGGKPTGSDIQGRHGNRPNPGEGMADWSMLFQRQFVAPIENKLSREFMSPLAQDISIEHDILEQQLRKQFRKDEKPDARLITEELLSGFHNDAASYTVMEGLLDIDRPHPLMIPIKNKKHAGIKKMATLFGWMNNLDLDDGPTIPGLSDRVMAWEDRDEDFANDDNWIANQSRYNPEYDLKGFYYRWIEPRFKPQLWDNATNEDIGNVHPARRFGGKVDAETTRIINILLAIKKGIGEKLTRATRLIVTNDVAPMIEKFFSGNDGIETKKYLIGHEQGGQEIISVWIYAHGVSEKEIHHAEHYLQHKTMDAEVKEVAEELFGTKSRKDMAMAKIIETAKNMAIEYELPYPIYLVGSYAREKAFGFTNPDIGELSFICSSLTFNFKFGQMLAHKLGVTNGKIVKPLTYVFTYHGLLVTFRGEVSLGEIPELAQSYCDEHLEDGLIRDLCNRDFTINMLAYNLLDNKLENPLKIQEDFSSKTLRTPIDPDIILQHNPIVILRALKLKLQYGLTIDRFLIKAMIENAHLLFDGRYSDQFLEFARQSIYEEGKEKAEKLFRDFGLNQLVR